MSDPRWTEYVALDDVVESELNPKDHDIGMVKASIRRFGFVDGAIHDGRTGRIIAGHGRLETLHAMHDEGESAPDGIVAREDGGWMMPVQFGWSSRSDAEAAALLVVLNKATEAGGWDPQGLHELLDGLKGLDADPELFELSGFTDAEFAKLAARLDTVPDFDPEAGDGTRLDQREPTQCPSCGHRWRVGPRGEVQPC